MFWRKNIVLADPFVPIGMKEAGLISGLSSVSFVLAGPILAGYLGAYVACTSAGCALTMAAVSSGAGGTAAGVAGAGLTNLMEKTDTETSPVTYRITYDDLQELFGPDLKEL